MIQGIRDVYYNVQDMGRAVRFYTEALGMRVLHGSEYWTSLDAGVTGVTVGLHWTEGPAVPRIPRDDHGAHAGATLTLNSTDLATDRKLLEVAGAKILGESKNAWGDVVAFEDLDGNVLKLMTPKQ